MPPARLHQGSPDSDGSKLSLLDKRPKAFAKVDVERARSLPLGEKLEVFYESKYPESTWWFHKIIGIGQEVRAKRTLDRLAVLDFGRKIAEDVPTEVQRNEAVIAAYLGGHGTAPAIAREAS